jgi:hypothetical protein
MFLFGDCKADSSRRDSSFGFEVVDQSGDAIEITNLVFSGNGGKWPVGDVGDHGSKSVDCISSAVPDSADISWKDAQGATHNQHVQITPLPADLEYAPPGSNNAEIYFVIGHDGTAQIAFHDPRLAEMAARTAALVARAKALRAATQPTMSNDPTVLQAIISYQRQQIESLKAQVAELTKELAATGNGQPTPNTQAGP